MLFFRCYKVIRGKSPPPRKNIGIFNLKEIYPFILIQGKTNIVTHIGLP